MQIPFVHYFIISLFKFTVMKRQNIITGIWKFRNIVPVEALFKFAKKLEEDKRYIQLYIRQTSKTQNGICFMYNVEDKKDSEKNLKEYLEETSDKLKREFGNDLAGWDISSSIIIIK